MLAKFLESIFSGPADQNPPATREQQLQLAVAVLLVDVARADWEHAPQERETITAALATQFSLDHEHAQNLVREAENTLDVETSLYRFLELLNRECSIDEKRELMNQLWEVAFADGELSKYEEHAIRRLADLLHISHADFIRSKHRQSGE